MIVMEKFCPVGETIEHYGRRIRAVETTFSGEEQEKGWCLGCVYDGRELGACIELQCDPESRADEKYVIFKGVAE